MNTKSRLIMRLLVAAFICQLTACGGGGSSTPAATPAGAVTGISSAAAVSAVSAK